MWKNEKFTFTEKLSHQMSYKVSFVIKTLFSRNFCQKSVKVNFPNFHTVHSASVTALHLPNFILLTVFRKISWKQLFHFALTNRLNSRMIFFTNDSKCLVFPLHCKFPQFTKMCMYLLCFDLKIKHLVHTSTTEFCSL